MFVMNCTVKTDEVLRYKTQQDSKQKRRRKGRNQKKGTTESELPDPTPSGMNAGEVYHPVQCSECFTEVAVYDKEEVYHFFNILASHCWDTDIPSSLSVESHLCFHNPRHWVFMGCGCEVVIISVIWTEKFSLWTKKTINLVKYINILTINLIYIYIINGNFKVSICISIILYGPRQEFKPQCVKWHVNVSQRQPWIHHSCLLWYKINNFLMYVSEAGRVVDHFNFVIQG